MPKCKIHFLGPPFNVKLVAERPPGVVFVRRVLRIPSKCKLTFSRPPQKHREHVAYILGTSHPLKTVVIVQYIIRMYIYINNCRASHTGDACRGRGREREREISSELGKNRHCRRCRRCRCCRRLRLRRRRRRRRRCCYCCYSCCCLVLLSLSLLSL